MEPLRILGIPVTSPGYYLNCAMTLAQVELMAIDVSVVDYGDMSKSKKSVPKNPYERLKNMESEYVDSDKVKAAADKWREKYSNGGGVQIDLSGYSLPSQRKSYTLNELKELSEKE